MRTLAASTAGALVLAAASFAAVAPGAHASVTDTASTSKIDWGPCTTGGPAGADSQCGFLSVPMDWSNPAGKQIQIAVSREKATAKRRGVILANPGGPGGSGLALSSLRDTISNGAGKGYDWIGFDPRGVGQSKPAISCDPNYEKGPRPDYTPESHGSTLSHDEDAWLALSKKYAGECGQKYGDLLSHMKTEDTVRDMDAIRSALGEKKISYYGFSYGTYLGQVYATLFPTHVDRMVLDGNVDPKGVWYDAQLSQDKAFEGVSRKFFSWVAAHNNTYYLGSTEAAVRGKYYAVLKQLAGKPVSGIGPSEWVDTFSHTMYAEFLWPDAAGAFASWVNRHDMSEAQVAYQSAQDPDDNGFAVYNAVQCTDTAWPSSYDKVWRPDGFKTATEAPFETWANVWYNTACLFWPAKAGTPIKVDGAKAPPMLLINATLDGATPFADALDVRKLFPSSRLVAEKDATSHANSLGGNPCIEDRVAKYLANGELPARKSGDGPDVVCNRVAEPTPGFGSYEPKSATPVTPSTPAPSGPSTELPPNSTPPQDPSPADPLLGLVPTGKGGAG
ncbi:MAG TPA: alpha/beta hydrolase [Sporichthyaceae bacterium]|nr:alpha/beta hydrolase [Sporichthyaceae bacterium]